MIATAIISSPSLLQQIRDEAARADIRVTEHLSRYAVAVVESLFNKLDSPSPFNKDGFHDKPPSTPGCIFPTSDKEDVVSTPDAVIFFNKESQAFAEGLTARTTQETIDPSIAYVFPTQASEPVKETDSVVEVLYKVIGELKEERNVLNAQIASLHRELTSLKGCPDDQRRESDRDPVVGGG